LNFQAFSAELSNRPTMSRASTSQFKTSRSALTSRTLRLRSAWLHTLGLDHRNRSGGGQVLNQPLRGRLVRGGRTDASSQDDIVL